MFHPAASPIKTVFIALPLFLSSPALAQTLTPKDAWDYVGAFISGTGGSLTSSGLLRDGDVLIAPNVVLTAPDALEIRIPEVRLEPRGEQVAVTPSPVFEVVATPGGADSRREFSVTHDGGFVASFDGEQLGLGLDFGGFTLTQTLATRFGQAIDDAFDMTLAGFGGEMSVTLAEPYSVRMDLRADDMIYDTTVVDTVLNMRQVARSQSDDVRITLAVDGLRDFEPAPGWVNRAFAGGLTARLDMTNGRSESQIEQQIMGDAQNFDFSVEGSTAAVALADGMVDVSIDANDFSLAGQMMGVDGAATLARFGMEFVMPVIGTDDQRPFRFGMTLQDMTIAEPLLALLGAGDFAGESKTLEFTLQANGRWLIEITDNPDPQEVPVDLGSVELSRLTARIGDSALTGGGRFDLAPGALETAGEGIPEGEGDFVLELRGGNALLGRLAAAGLIPPDQQFMAQMMMNALGRPVGEDHLRSEIAIRPGGQLLVNGMPLPF